MPTTTDTLATHLIAAWNAHDADQVVALHAEDFEGEDIVNPAPMRGRSDVRDHTARYLRAFPDLHFTIKDVVQQNGHVAISWEARGTHLGSLMHIPATGRVVEVLGMWMLEIADGAICRSTSVWDVAGMLRTLRLLPQLRPDEPSS